MKFTNMALALSASVFCFTSNGCQQDFSLLPDPGKSIMILGAEPNDGSWSMEWSRNIAERNPITFVGNYDSFCQYGYDKLEEDGFVKDLSQNIPGVEVFINNSSTRYPIVLWKCDFNTDAFAELSQRRAKEFELVVNDCVSYFMENSAISSSAINFTTLTGKAVFGPVLYNNNYAGFQHGWLFNFKFDPAKVLSEMMIALLEL